MAMARVIGYVRVSRVGARAGDGFLSPELQEQAIEELCLRKGLELVEVLPHELDASGGDASRPIWNRALGMVERGEVDGIAVWNLSRFSRSISDFLAAYERIEAAGGQLFSSVEDFDVSTPEGRLMRDLMVRLGQMERERAQIGFRRAQANAVARGVYIAARIPIGYVRGADRRLVPDPETALIVKELFDQRVKGRSWTELARWMVEQGHPMSRRGVSNLIANPAYIGHARGVAGIVNESAHEPLVAKLLFQRANERNAAIRNGKLKGSTLLQGFVTCSGCGSKLLVGWGRYVNHETHEYEREPQYFWRMSRAPWIFGGGPVVDLFMRV